VGVGGQADVVAGAATVEVVGQDVDAAVQARLPGLIGGVVVGGPLQGTSTDGPSSNTR
jgi:hypothetical protein